MIRTRTRLAAPGALALAALIGCAGQAHAQPPARSTAAGITGQWMIEPGDVTGTLQLTLQRNDGARRHHMSTNDVVASAQVRGLDWKQAQSSSGAAVRFQIQRDAGSFACEGWFRDGKGSGHFTFASSAAFVSDMRGLGYRLSGEEVFSLAVHDVTRAYVRELGRLGYRRLSYERLIAMHIHGVSPAYIRELAALGYRNLDSEQLVAMRIHGVSPEAIRQYAALGYRRLEEEQLVAMRIHGVSPELVRELSAEGYKAVPAEKLVAMRIHGVSPDFIRRLRKRGYDKLSVDELISLKIHGAAR